MAVAAVGKRLQNGLYNSKNESDNGPARGILRSGAGTESDPWSYSPRVDNIEAGGR